MPSQGTKKLNEPYFNNDEYKFLKKCIVNKSVSTYGKEVLEFENLCSKISSNKIFNSTIKWDFGITYGSICFRC